jgi:hypothetical protein
MKEMGKKERLETDDGKWATSADHKKVRNGRKDKPQKVKDTQNLLEGKKRRKSHNHECV